MTRSGYRAILVLLGLASLSGVFFSIWIQWTHGAPREMSCADWEERMPEGRFRLTDCELSPEPESFDGQSGIIFVGTHEHPWETHRADLVRTTRADAIGDRAYRRFVALMGETHDIEVEAVLTSREIELRDLYEAEVSLWVGLVPLLFFGLPIVLLVRKQRQWRDTRLAWERSKGVLTEGDKPSAF